MIYFANGGFNWHDLYFMPTHLREFYWNQLLNTKNKEKEEYDNSVRKSKTSNSSKTHRK